MTNLISTLAGERQQGDDKWWGSVAAANGSIYVIPFHARRVEKFNPVDKSITHIGPDLSRVQGH